MRVAVASLLTGAVLIAQVAIAFEAIAEEQNSATEVHGNFGAGLRVFVDRPPPRDRAKFEQYGEIRPGLYVDDAYLSVVTKHDFVAEMWASHVGRNNQNYLLQLSQPGEIYLTFEWDETPHLNSTKALTLFDASNPAALKVADSVQTALETGNNAARAATIAANVQPITLNVDRDTAKVALRYTPSPAWNIRLDYSHEDRNGNQGFGTAINGFNTIELPAPVFYTTQNFSASAEYVGTWTTDKRWNLNFTYNGSIFEDKYSSFTWDNPFRLTAPAGANTANEGRNSLPPDNQSHRVTLAGAIDLPFDSRYAGTVSYSQMRQNDSFIPFTINASILSSGAVPMTNLSLLPAPSLDGKIDETLINNVLTTRFSDELTGTARFRYLSVDNKTPLLFFPEYVRADGARQNDDRQNYRPAYTRTNSSADLNWRAMKGIMLGASLGWERYDRDNRDADVTDEYSAKIFVDATPQDWEWLSLRASVLHAERRYDHYDALNNVGVIGYPPLGTAFLQNPLMRKFDMADRNRTKADVSLEFIFESGWTITPTGSWRKDEFSDNLANGGDLGLKEETYWNAGIENSFTPFDGVSVMLSYLREDFDRTLVNRQKSVAGVGNPADNWGSRIHDVVDTFGGTAEIGLGTSELLPGTLDLDLNYIYAHTNNATDTYALGANNRDSIPPFPDVTNDFQHFDATLKYGVDPDLVAKLGWESDVTVKLRYAYERNNMANWATDSMVPYMVGVDSGANVSLFMAALNPNYEANIVTVELGFAW